MKLSAFKSIFSQRFAILKASCLFAFRKEVAYAGNNWAAVIATTAYTLTMLLFVNIIFGGTKQIAGYSHNDMIFYFLVAQASYYLNWYLSTVNVINLVTDVNQGNLDMILTKPVPAIFFLTTRNIGGFRLFVEALPSMLVSSLLIDWPALSINPTNLIYGIFIFIFGLISLHVLHFLAALPVFWLGESQATVDLVGNLATGSGSLIPLEGYSQSLKFALGALFPILITTAFSVSAILGKTNSQSLFFWSFAVVTVFIFIRNTAWKIAIKNYTSASS